jgi:hypothetical protein
VIVQVSKKMHDRVFFFLWPRQENFTWDRTVWRDRSALANEIASSEPDKWKRTDHRESTILIYQQTILAMMPRRVLSVEVRDGGALTLSNRSRPGGVAFAYVMVGFLILFEFAVVALTIQSAVTFGLACDEFRRGLLLLAICPLFIFGSGSLMGWLDYLTSRGPFIRLAHELAALTGVTYQPPQR